MNVGSTMKGETNQNLEVSFLGERDVERYNNHWTSAGGNPAKYPKRVNINPHVILPWNRYHENSCYRYQTCTIWHFNFVQMWSLPYLTESKMANKQKKKGSQNANVEACWLFIFYIQSMGMTAISRPGVIPLQAHRRGICWWDSWLCKALKKICQECKIWREREWMKSL